MVITGLYASLIAILYLILAYRVVRLRLKFKIGLLDDGNSTLRKAIRVHGNASEYMPLFLILFALAESNHTSPYILHFLGVFVFCHRIWHALGVSKSQGLSKGRFYGTLGTWIGIVTLVCINVYYFVVSVI